MAVKTLEQEIAKFAYEIVKNSGESEKREFKKLPNLIMTNGLIPTLAYYKDDKKPYKMEVYRTILKWIKEEKKLIQNENLDELLNADSQTLRKATLEALKLSNYLKRFSEM
ncbi:type III-B CRISPR module-associated protein Cmr5 [Candidatus Chrysopegis kryptomonas]|uniref:CRISPR type III-B/RAMP module-associated protein Cmr5 n=2 Tax=Bacteria TaxID=2 RepID=A0A0P1NZF8_9BACT|nr:type III-B CRISPR module-associated protein Cmr5 [Candidatus Chrysopegis kryptomonas]CUT04661.1 CRISPR type III-B/RAMP module-associated protein Cmr5 [Candidatus Chrysopegis kryptomonas]